MILSMRYEGREIAAIATGERAFELRYNNDWLSASDAFPISLNMPLGEVGFGEEIVIPWLMNLLPEGEPLRAMSRALGASAEDVIGLIVKTGGDLAGALTIGHHETSGAPHYQAIPGADALERIINELPVRPFLADEVGVTMSLAGAQDKLPVAMPGGKLAIPLNGAASTHILKPDNPRLHGSVQNEALCMVLSRRIGLRTAPVTTGVAGARSYLLVERYDRSIDHDPIRRIHQEDFCQAFGRPPVAKYQFNGAGRRGPSLPDMFSLVREHMTALEITRLLDAVIFNIAIGNVDSHAKNYSILLQPSIGFAPLYDLMTGLAWEGITPNHAQEVGGQRRGAHIYGRNWQRMAKESGLAAAATVRRVTSVADRILGELAAAAEEVAAMPAGAGPFLKTFTDAIGERATAVRNHAEVRREEEEEEELSTEPSAIPGENSAYPS